MEWGSLWANPLNPAHPLFFLTAMLSASLKPVIPIFVQGEGERFENSSSHDKILSSEKKGVLMSELIFALPVSVEQIAIVIKQMSRTEQERLLALVPSLRQIAAQPSVRTPEQIQANIARLQTEVLTALNNKPLSSDEPFVGNLTLAQYHVLPDEKKTELWDKWAAVDLMELEEQEVNSNALSTG